MTDKVESRDDYAVRNIRPYETNEWIKHKEREQSIYKKEREVGGGDDKVELEILN